MDADLQTMQLSRNLRGGTRIDWQCKLSEIVSIDVDEYVEDQECREVRMVGRLSVTTQTGIVRDSRRLVSDQPAEDVHEAAKKLTDWLDDYREGRGDGQAV